MGAGQDSGKAGTGTEKECMKIRSYTDDDNPKVRAMHAAMGLDYRLPDLNSPMVPDCQVCEQDGRVVAVAALKLEAETYLWVDPNAAPAEKWLAIRMLMKVLARNALAMGIEQMVSYVPACLKSRFIKRMLTLGWEKPRDGWTPMVYEVKP